MQQQAMAVGRPIISIRYGGVCEFFSFGTGNSIGFSETAAGGFYTGCGSWATPSEKHVIELMRRVYHDRNEARILGERASVAVSSFTWEESNRVLLNQLKDLGMIRKRIADRHIS